MPQLNVSHVVFNATCAKGDHTCSQNWRGEMQERRRSPLANFGEKVFLPFFFSSRKLGRNSFLNTNSSLGFDQVRLFAYSHCLLCFVVEGEIWISHRHACMVISIVLPTVEPRAEVGADRTFTTES